MANQNAIVYTSSDYAIALSIGGNKNVLATCEEVKYGSKIESEFLHIVGSDYPVALKSNAITFEGNLTLQAGELEAILVKAGVLFLTEVKDNTISISALNGSFSRVFKSVIFDSHEGGTKAKDKDSKITINWKGLSVN